MIPNPHLFVGTQKMDVSKNSGTPKSSILIRFSIINHPFWGTPIFGNTQNPQDVQLSEKAEAIGGRFPEAKIRKKRFFFGSNSFSRGRNLERWGNPSHLGGGFKYLLFSPLPEEDSHFD